MKKRKTARSTKSPSWPEYTNRISVHGYRYFSLLVIVLFALFLPGQNHYSMLQLEFNPPLVRASEFDNFQPSPYPKKIYNETAPYLTAESVMIRDLESSAPIYELNTHIHLRPASITKLMTALVVLDQYNLDTILTVGKLETVKDEADMGLQLGDKINVKNLIYGLLIPSGNDAAYTLAYNYPGGIENFVSSMNEKAKELHMEDTHFDNPSGLDSPTHYTTSHDLSLLAMEVLKSDFLSNLIKTRYTTVSDITGERIYKLQNVNQLLGLTYGVDGIKTGFTDEAGQCLITSATRDGHRVMVVLLKSQDRFGESAKLVEWVFRNYKWVDLTTEI
jgi:D-alanyl-D-alanine carboxypeptidase